MGVVHGEVRHLLGNRQPLALVGVEDGRLAPAVEAGSQQPAEVGGVGQPSVHPVTGVRHPEVGGIAADERAPVAEVVGHQPASEPVLVRDDLVLERVVDAEDGADSPVTIDGVEVRLLLTQIVVDQPGLTTVDGVDGSAAARVERDIAPGRFRRQQREQLRSADVARLDTLDDGVAVQLRADPASHLGAAAVAANEVARCNLHILASFQIVCIRRHAIVVLREMVELNAVVDGNAWRLPGVLEEDWLKIDLVDPGRRLRRRPPGIRSTCVGVAVTAAWDRDAGQLTAGHRRPVGDIVGVVFWQAGVSYLSDDTKPAKDLHRAGSDMVALHAWRLATLAQLQDGNPLSTTGQVERQRQPNRPSADDQDVGINR